MPRETEWRPSKIISGGQTGADRGGLDAAIELSISHGGWCPRGRIAEDGPVPERYKLEETLSSEYPTRTRLNISNSDATIIFICNGREEAGTKLTKSLAISRRKPWLIVDVDDSDRFNVDTITEWLRTERPRILNVAGSRESKAPGIQRQVRKLLVAVLAVDERNDDGDDDDHRP